MFKLIKKFKLNYNKKVEKRKFYKDDIFIVSYPKSGNTWMRFLLANLLTDEEVNFHSAVKYIPDFEAHYDAVNSMSRPRLLKSHSLYNENFSKVIYIIRDPRDVYVSYFHYLKKHLELSESDFKTFVRNQELHPSRWQVHVSSWLDDSRDNILLIKYEDMLINTFKELKKVVQFIGWNKSDSELKLAIEKSSFDSMSKIEDEKGRPFINNEAKRKSTKFVRSGKQGDWKNYFDIEDLNFLNKELKSVVEKFGYRILE
ncbi:sulfotransferase domain-containing protein [Urechidicola sp. KH5]